MDQHLEQNVQTHGSRKWTELLAGTSVLCFEFHLITAQHHISVVPSACQKITVN